VICAGGRDASEAQLGLPSEAEEVFGRLTASVAHFYENARTNTGKMPALPAFSCFVVAMFAMGVGIADALATTGRARRELKSRRIRARIEWPG